jgi:hypothetical protein
MCVNPVPLRRAAAIGAMSLVASFALGVAGHTAASAAPAGFPHNETLKQILAEEEHEDFDSPTQSALCQSFIGQPNPYHDPAPNVDQIVGDTIVQAGSQTGCSAAQNETTIAVNPHNARNIVAGTNDYRVFNSRENRNDASGWAYTSFDGGRTWANVQLPHLTFQTGGTGALSFMDSAGDPTIAFGPNNTVYYANIAFSRALPFGGAFQMASAITVNVSHDGGLHWSEPHILALDGVDAAGTPTPTEIFNDKVWVAADRSSGRAYVTWSRFEFPGGNYLQSPIVVSASADFGGTWSAANQVAPTLAGFTGGITPYDQGSNPQVGRDGTLYVAYEASVCHTLACNQAGDRDATVVSTSRDHGGTFSHAIVDTNFDFPARLTGENFRENSYPQLAYDPILDRLYVQWNDDRNGLYDATTGASIKTNGDNIVATSRGGAHWSGPTVIGTPQDEFFGAVATFGGVVAVSSYTRHYDPSGINLDYAYWKSFGPSGLGHARINRITTQSSDPRIQFLAIGPNGEEIQGVFIGDYSAMAVGTDLRIHPCWTDFRGRPGVTAPNQDAYTQSISLIG